MDPHGQAGTGLIASDVPESAAPTVRAYFDESQSKEGWVLVGAVVAPEPEILEASILDLAADTLANSNVWTTTKKRSDFAQGGFHHCEDDETVRGRLFDCLQGLNFRAHVAYSKGGMKPLEKGDLELVMYYTLVRNLLRRYAGAALELVFENSSHLDPHFGGLVKQAIDSLRGAPRATPVRATIGVKGLGGLAAVDYVMAAATDYLRSESGGNVENFRMQRFRQVRGHAAHLIDFDRATHRSKLAKLL